MLSIILLLFISTNPASSGENDSILNQVEQASVLGDSNFHMEINPALRRKANIINKVLVDFKQKYKQFDYGIHSMESLYDVIENPEVIYEDMKGHTCTRSVTFAGEVLVGAACEVIKCLSVFHQKCQGYGDALIGLYIAKAALWGFDSWLYGTDKESSINVINALQADPLLDSSVSAMTAQMNQVDFSPVTLIAKNVIALAEQEDLSESDRTKLNRLIELNSKLQNTYSMKKILLIGGKILSFITGIATGISITVSGQNSASSYWLTLIAGGLDSIIDSARTTLTKKPITQKYITISEILFLSDYFLEKYREEVV